MQAVNRQPCREPEGAPVRCECHRPEQTTLYRLVQQQAATCFEQAEAAAGAKLPQFVKGEFDAFVERGILAHGFLRLRGSDCGHDKLVACSCKRRGFCPSCGARRMAQTAAQPVDHALALPPGRSPGTNSPPDCSFPRSLPRVLVRQRVLSLPIPLRLLLAAQLKLVTPVLQVSHRAITRFLLDQAGLKAEQADSGTFTVIQRFGSAANLNTHLHCLVLDGVYRCGADGAPVRAEASAPTDEALHAVLHKIITHMMKLLTRRGVLVEAEGSTSMADSESDSDEARTLRPLQAAAWLSRPPRAIGPAPRQAQTVHRTVCVRSRLTASPLARAPGRRC